VLSFWWKFLLPNFKSSPCSSLSSSCIAPESVQVGIALRLFFFKLLPCACCTVDRAWPHLRSTATHRRSGWQRELSKCSSSTTAASDADRPVYYYCCCTITLSVAAQFTGSVQFKIFRAPLRPRHFSGSAFQRVATWFPRESRRYLFVTKERKKQRCSRRRVCCAPKRCRAAVFPARLKSSAVSFLSLRHRCFFMRSLPFKLRCAARGGTSKLFEETYLAFPLFSRAFVKTILVRYCLHVLAWVCFG